MKAKVLQKIKEYEDEGKFNEHLFPLTTKNMVKVDENYKYEKNNLFFKLGSFFTRLVLTVFGPLVTFVFYGLKVKGRKNLKGIRGGMVISNHVLVMDNLLIRHSVCGLHRKYYVVGMNNNCKNNAGGKIMQCAGFLPVGATISAQKNFIKSLQKIVDKNGIVHFYPEQALWNEYKKSRPFKRGAFYYATEVGAVIVPAFVLFRKPKGFFKLIFHHDLVTVKICEPIYADLTLPKRERSEKLMADSQKVYNDVIDEFYGYKRR